jgi:hypothetical protein
LREVYGLVANKCGTETIKFPSKEETLCMAYKNPESLEAKTKLIE